MPQNSFNTILVVDGNEQNRYACSKYLQNAGYEIWQAATGKEALALVEKNPSLVVLDVQLPDMSGFEVCARIKNNPESSTIPVLHTSAAFVQSGDRIRGLEVGADAYLISPIQTEELVASVRALLRTRKAEVIAHNLAVQWESTFDAISDGICVVGANGLIERCNFGFAKMAGRPLASIVGQNFAGAELGNSMLFRDLLALKVAETGKKEVSETKVGESWLRVSADPIWSQSKQLAGAVYIVSDITERKEAEIALALANAKIKSHALELEEKVAERTSELQRTIKSLDTFCYTIAHDLKSPLRSIKGFTGILREEYEEKLDDVGKDYTKRIVDSVERLNRLIDDLLDYGRLSNMELPIEHVELEEELEFVLHELWADAKVREAAIDVRKPLPAVLANSTVIKQVLSNLISNAIKFVEPAIRPDIKITSEELGDSVRINVFDNGIGIDPACFGRIFNVFERLHGKDSGYPGTGIGLAIVRKGVERMGGTVGVESENGKGSRFWVVLPKSASAAE